MNKNLKIFLFISLSIFSLQAFFEASAKGVFPLTAEQKTKMRATKEESNSLLQSSKQAIQSANGDELMARRMNVKKSIEGERSYSNRAKDQMRRADDRGELVKHFKYSRALKKSKKRLEDLNEHLGEIDRKLDLKRKP